ncbi:WD40 repeat domain-containing protein [Streptacidiphilus carbonis]|uniref:WD40 repeat domain-containing protein n=1 Tax=Streptacidiphilus carbonis TaxID=105422 RepID=UPI001F2E7887|nr:WD40 repeat domain-containing protein [Streptacidiphilus carbonis]
MSTSCSRSVTLSDVSAVCRVRSPSPATASRPAPESGREFIVVGVHDNQVSGLAWHPHGSCLATASRDRSVRIWESTTDMEPLAQARSVLPATHRQ